MPPLAHRQSQRCPCCDHSLQIPSGCSTMYIVSPWEQMLAAGTKQGPSTMFPPKPWCRVLSMPTIHNISSSLGQDFVHVGQHQAPSSAEGVCVCWQNQLKFLDRHQQL